MWTSRMVAYFAAIISVAFAANHGPSPWDKYQFAPKTRTVYPVSFKLLPHGPFPPGPPGPAPGPTPSAACPPNTTGGVVDEWIVPGKSAPQITLSCPGSGSTIGEVLFASFGTPSGTCLAGFNRSSCHAADSVTTMRSACSGRASCKVPSDLTIRDTHSPLEQMFGDPCFGVKKHLAVQFKCVGGSPSPSPPSPPPAPKLPLTLSSQGSSILFDFGKEVGGITTLNFGSVSDSNQRVLISYSESSLYALGGDHSNGGSGPDGYIDSGFISAHSPYTIPVNHMRGGFRYMQVVLATTGTVEIEMPSLHFTATPNLASPADWKNHFYSSDDLLNRIWYGAGYTTQLCSIDPRHGRQWGPPPSGWNNNVSCGVGDTVLVDGAKRDRVIWPGDMGVSVLTALATTGDVEASANALLTLYQHQSNNGMLPYAGPPVNFEGGSDTYHLWALIGTFHVTKATSTQWLKTAIPDKPGQTVWQGYTRGVATSIGQINANSGLFNVVHRADWARQGQGGENIAANALLYFVLTNAAELASSLNLPSLAEEYSANASSLKSSINTHLWDPAKGAFKDNTAGSTVYPQDGNSLAVWLNATSSPDQVASISAYLSSNWNEYGSQTPEWRNDIGTFPGSMEVHAHGVSGNTTRMHALIRLMWGYMLHNPLSTLSTFWEGYHRDGSFSYQSIYMSNAHGWSTGPASALTAYTLGIQHSIMGNYLLRPNPGGVEWATGRYHFEDDGYVEVAWNVTCSGEGVRGGGGGDGDVGGDVSNIITFDMTVDSSTMPHTRMGRLQLSLTHLLRHCTSAKQNSLSNTPRVAMDLLSDMNPSSFTPGASKRTPLRVKVDMVGSEQSWQKGWFDSKWDDVVDVDDLRPQLLHVKIVVNHMKTDV